MGLPNIKIANDQYLAVLTECFHNLKVLAHSMTNECVRKSTLHEFLYKLRCLEKELHFISIRLKDTWRKNDTLAKDLESEKDRSRKRAARIHELESQLANAEFKLKLRHGSRDRSKFQRDASFQYGCRLDSKTDLFHTMQNLRAAAHDTINTIRELVASGRGDFKSPLRDELDASLKEARDLREENAYLHQLISQNNLSIRQRSSLTVTLSKQQVDIDINNTDWDDPEYAYKIINNMEQKIEKLKFGNLRIGKKSSQGSCL